MKIYFITKTCTHRPGPGQRAIYLEKDSYYHAKDDEVVPLEYMELVPDVPPTDKPAEIKAVELVADIRSKKDVCEELDALNVVYSKKASIKDLEGLLVDAKKMRNREKD